MNIMKTKVYRVRDVETGEICHLDENQLETFLLGYSPEFRLEFEVVDLETNVYINGDEFLTTVINRPKRKDIVVYV